jgi:hypothetical protein
MEPISIESVTRNISVHIPFYSWHRPVYQHVMLETVQRFWDVTHRSALDVGGGTGVVAQTPRIFFVSNASPQWMSRTVFSNP